MRWSGTVLVAAVALCLLAGTAAASTVRFLSDAELIARADRVVHGSVTGQRVVRVAPGVIYTISTLAVIEDLTGVAGDSVEVWERGERSATNRCRSPAASTSRSVKKWSSA